MAFSIVSKYFETLFPDLLIQANSLKMRVSSIKDSSMNKQFFRITLLLLGSIFLLLACKSSTELPGAFEQVNPVSGEVKQITVYPQNSDSDSTEANLGASPYLFLGNYKGYTSYTLCRFYVNDLPNPDSSKIKSVGLTLFSATTDTSITEFPTIVPKMRLLENIKEEWDELEITWQDFNQGDLNSRIISQEPSTALTVDDTIHLNFEVQMITNEDSTIDSTFITNGFLIEAETDEMENILKSFYSFETAEIGKQPLLTIVSEHNGTLDTTYSISGQDASILNNPEPGSTESLCYVGNSFTTRLHFGNIPLAENATVNRARLEIVIDKEHSIFGLNQTYDLKAYPFQWGEEPLGVYYASDPLNEDTLSFEVNSQVQDWSSKDDTENDGFALRSVIENVDIIQMAVYNHLADSLRRPKLVIDYTLPPAVLK